MRPAITIRNADDARRLFATLADAPDEAMAIGYLDPKWRLLGLRHLVGGRARVQPSLRTLVRDALTFDAVALVIAHNHPSGDTTPSAEDIAFTRDCARTMRSVDVALTDHLILAGARWTSFRALGLL